MTVDFRNHHSGSGVTFLFKCGDNRYHSVDYTKEMLEEYPKLFDEIMITQECPTCNPEIEANGRRRSYAGRSD